MESLRRFSIAGRMKQNKEQRQRLGEGAAAAETENDHSIRQLDRTPGRKSLEIEILRNVVGGVAAVRFTPRHVRL